MMRSGSGMGMGMGGREFFPGGMSMIFGGLTMLIIVALLVVILVLVIKMYKAMTNGKCIVKPSTTAVPAAMDTLNDRFAKGEISEEEYSNRKELLLK